MAPKSKTNNTARHLRFDEVNVGRLGLISIHERIPENFVDWEVSFDLNGRPGRLRCMGVAKLGVPHGLDNDISSALINLFLEAGAPEDGWFHTTAYRILIRAGLRTSGRYYQALHESLQRLRGATYYATDSWYDVRRHYVTATFNYLEGLEYSSDEEDIGLSQGSVLKIKLAKPITASLRAKYIRPLDEALLSRMERPLTRALYRLLEGRRADVQHPDEALGAFSVGLREWAQQCKIIDPKPARIRRTLDPAHEELVALGYLGSVAYGGTRTAQTVTYSFEQSAKKNDTSLSPAPALIATLARHGIGRSVALQLTEQFGEAHVLERIRKFQAILATGYTPKNPSGLLRDVIQDTNDKYPDPPGYTPARVTPASTPPPARAEPGATTPPDDDEATRRAQPLEQQIEECLRSLQLILKSQLSTAEYARIREKLALGMGDPVEMGRQCIHAAFAQKLPTFVNQLRAFAGQ